MILFQNVGRVLKHGREYSQVTINGRYYMVEESNGFYGVAPMFGFSRWFNKDKKYIRAAMKKNFQATKGSIILSRTDSTEDVVADDPTRSFTNHFNFARRKVSLVA